MISQKELAIPVYECVSITASISALSIFIFGSLQLAQSLPHGLAILYCPSNLGWPSYWRWLLVCVPYHRPRPLTPSPGSVVILWSPSAESPLILWMCPQFPRGPPEAQGQFLHQCSNLPFTTHSGNLVPTSTSSVKWLFPRAPGMWTAKVRLCLRGTLHLLSVKHRHHSSGNFLLPWLPRPPTLLKLLCKYQLSSFCKPSP